MKILYISQYFPPEIGAPSARVAELSRLWVREGHDVSVLTGFPNHPTGIVPLEYRHHMRRLIMRELIDGIDVTRTWLLPLPNRKSHERILNYSSFLFSSAMTGTFLNRPDIVIATSPQLLVGLAGWWVARSQHVPFILEVRDLWPESLEAVGQGSKGSFVYRSLSRVADFLYRNADHIVVVTPAFRTYLVETRGIPFDKISVVENGVDTHLFHPQASQNTVRAELGLGNKFVVSYIGTHGNAQGLETVLEAAGRLKNSHPHVAFLLLGEGAEKEKLISMAHSRDLTNITFTGRQPHEKIPGYIAASNVCVVMLKKTELFKTVLPTKLLEYMSCSRPVILGVDGEARRILDQARAGIFVEPQNAKELADIVVKLNASPHICQRLGQNGRNYIVQHFSREQTASRYLEVLENLVNEDSLVQAA